MNMNIITSFSVLGNKKRLMVNITELNPEKTKYHRKNITPSDIEARKKKIEALMARNDGESDHATE